jgi:transcription initiation factor IIE alpha subunit
MNLCSDGHQEICHEGNTCPLCEAISEHKGMDEANEDKINELKNKIDDLEQQISQSS